MSDLLVNLYQKFECSEEALLEKGIRVKRALPMDKAQVLQFVRYHFTDSWADECEHAFSSTPCSCFIAVRDKEIVGFSCYDATAKGYFGPIGTASQEKGSGVGKTLLARTLCAMREAGYGYAIIGWASQAAGFYHKHIKAMEIPDSEPDQTVYRNRIS